MLYMRIDNVKASTRYIIASAFRIQIGKQITNITVYVIH